MEGAGSPESLVEIRKVTRGHKPVVEVIFMAQFFNLLVSYL
jgi:hypothetical protein